MSGAGESGPGSNLRERAFEFACSVIELHRFVYTHEPSLRGTSAQAASAAGSIGANLEEADAAQSRADFISKCNISLKEARESRYWLRILSRFITSERLSELIAEATELIAILTTIVRKSREAR
ncbi:MAG TPA: four helix bundle protein [Thermoanaerobaculia bacterium]|nr:four helix bundle protein [Thermoanaerobaculia bacterium]